LKTDLTELKEEKRKNDDVYNSKMRYIEQQKAELAAREETTRESLAQALKERERIELEAEDKLNQLRRDMVREK
jgi:Arc/MetJ-type ribon-helix-helix transcriptional regulator